MNFRTDLAIELAQQLQDAVSQDYQTVQKEEDGAVVFHTKIRPRQGKGSLENQPAITSP